MPAHPRVRRSRQTRERGWDQTSFLDVAGTAELGNATREVEDVLGLADHPADPVSGREALDRLYDHLAQRALQRGRKPFPKLSEARDGP